MKIKKFEKTKVFFFVNNSSKFQNYKTFEKL